METMSQYITQREDGDCGPIAIVNVCKWLGIEKPWDLNKIRKALGTTKLEGTSVERFDKVLSRVCMKVGTVHRVKRPRLRFIERHIKQGGAILLVFNYKKMGHHVTLFTKPEPFWGETIFVNAIGLWLGIPNAPLDRNEFKKGPLQYQRVDPRYEGWFLTRKA